MRTKIIQLILSCFLLIASQVTLSETLDRVVAVVNDDVITQTELKSEMNNITLQMRANGHVVTQDESFKEKTLNHLIDKKLQLQIAKQANITISDKELNSIITRIAQQNQISTSDLLERIQQEGMSTKKYKDNLREQLLLQKVQQQEVASKITITPQEIDNMSHSPKWKKQLINGHASAATKKAIESEILQAKFEEAGLNWLSRLRGVAYIEIKKS